MPFYHFGWFLWRRLDVARAYVKSRHCIHRQTEQNKKRRRKEKGTVWRGLSLYGRLLSSTLYHHRWCWRLGISWAWRQHLMNSDSWEKARYPHCPEPAAWAYSPFLHLVQEDRHQPHAFPRTNTWLAWQTCDIEGWGRQAWRGGRMGMKRRGLAGCQQDRWWRLYISIPTYSA